LLNIAKRHISDVMDGIIAKIVQSYTVSLAEVLERRRATLSAAAAKAQPRNGVGEAAVGRGCGCDGCAGAPESALPLTVTAVNKMNLAPVRKAELLAHGIVDAGNAAAQKTSLKLLATKHALRLTGGARQARDREEDCPDAAEVETTPTGASATVPMATESPVKRPPPKRMAMIPSPSFDLGSLKPRHKSRVRLPDSPDHPMQERDGDDRSPPSIVPAALLCTLGLGVGEHLDPRVERGYAWACNAILSSHLLLYADYARAAWTATCHSLSLFILPNKMFASLLEALLLLTSSLLDEWLLFSTDVVDMAYHTARRTRNSFKWPMYAGKGVCLQADACFQVVGYQSPHGMVHVVDSFTQLTVARCHLTKHELPSSLTVRAATGGFRSVNGILTNSGDLDWYGTTKCLEWLHEHRPLFLLCATMTRDGDVIGHPIDTLVPAALLRAEARLFDAACYTHALKNLFKFGNKTLPTESCMCGAGKSNRNHRFTGALLQKMHAWVYHLLEQAELSYLPEKQHGFCAEGSFPATISDIERAAMRDKAIEHMRLEIDVMLGHLQGEHSRCTHGPLKEDTTSFCCSAQVVKLTAYLGVLKKNLPLLLSALGKTHVQYAESNHSVVAKVRPKGTQMSATACFLGEALALLHVSELQLAAHGEFRSSLGELSVLVEEHLGVSFQVDVEQRMCTLNKRLRMKLRRATPAHKKKVAATKLRKRAALAKNQKGTSGAYASGASSAAHARASTKA